MLHPSLAKQVPAEARARWQRDGTVRLAPFLRDDAAGELLDALRALPHRITAGEAGDAAFVCYEHAYLPEAGCDHVACRFGRWLYGDGVAWVASFTGQALAPPPEASILSTLYGKGCYLDAHADAVGTRAVAFVLGLTRASWPPAEGGHLELLRVDGGRVEVSERRAPGWNTLDLLDVRGANPWHRIPLVTAHHERRAVSGWFHTGAPPAAL